jgi:hypothetical protein
MMQPIDRRNDRDLAHIVPRAAATTDATASVVQSTIELFSARESVPTNELAATTFRLVRAVLSFDTLASPQVALGMRSLAFNTRNLMFSAAGRYIDLRISPVRDLFKLTGQIFGPDNTALVELVTQSEGALDRRAARIADLGVFGDFRLDGVQRGTYQMILRIGCDAVVLPTFEVGERSGG